MHRQLSLVGRFLQRPTTRDSLTLIEKSVSPRAPQKPMTKGSLVMQRLSIRCSSHLLSADSFYGAENHAKTPWLTHQKFSSPHPIARSVRLRALFALVYPAIPHNHAADSLDWQAWGTCFGRGPQKPTEARSLVSTPQHFVKLIMFPYVLGYGAIIFMNSPTFLITAGKIYIWAPSSIRQATWTLYQLSITIMVLRGKSSSLAQLGLVVAPAFVLFGGYSPSYCFLFREDWDIISSSDTPIPSSFLQTYF